MATETNVKTTTPQILMKAEISYSTSLTGNRIKIGYVQKMGALKTLKEGTAYSAVDLDEERMAKGKRKAEAVDIETLFIQSEHEALMALAEAETEIYLFAKYPETTAKEQGKPLVQTVKCDIDVAGNELSDGDFIKDTIRVFKHSKTVETAGYPTEADATKFN